MWREHRTTYCLWPYCHLLFNVNESLHTLTKIPLLLNISYNSQYSLFVLPKLSICGTLITRQQQHPPPLHPSNPLTSKLLSSWSLDFFYKKLFKYVCKLWPHFRQSIKCFFLFFAFLVENSTSCLPLWIYGPEAICSPLCCLLTVASLAVSLPAEKEAWGCAENKIRYLNLSERSPTSYCVFLRSVKSTFLGWWIRHRRLCVRACAQTMLSHISTLLYCILFFLLSTGDEVRSLCASHHLFPLAGPEAAVQPEKSIDSAAEPQLFKEQTGRRRPHRRQHWQNGGRL